MATATSDAGANPRMASRTRLPVPAPASLAMASKPPSWAIVMARISPRYPTVAWAR